DFSSPSRFVRVAFLRAQILMEDIKDDGIVEFFHILNNVAMVKGSVITKDGKDEITQYSSCMNLEKGLYYYKSYNNNQVNMVDMHKEDLDSSEMKIFPYNDIQVVNTLN
ncbi:MAG: linear amide C-N hydrolase, partial [Intestinibacter bartlettii]